LASVKATPYTLGYACGLSYRSESFELHKILRVVRSGKFSAQAKFTTASTTPIQSFVPQDTILRTLEANASILNAGPTPHRQLCLGVDKTLHKLL
jgi:hypothetical protein